MIPDIINLWERGSISYIDRLVRGKYEGQTIDMRIVGGTGGRPREPRKMKNHYAKDRKFASF